MTNERWLPVLYAPGYYVSDMGHMRGPRGALSVYKTDGWGYPWVRMYVNGKRIERAIHVVVLETFTGPCPSGLEACHDNGVNWDNRLSNLRWDTPEANEADKAHALTFQERIDLIKAGY